MEKKKLIVMASWDKPIEKTWSGSAYSVAKSLERYYDVLYVNLQIGQLLRIMRKLSQIPYLGLLFGYLYEIICQYKANKSVEKYPNVPVLQIPFSIHIKNPHFYYQDMTYSAGEELLRLKKNHTWIYDEGINNSRCPSDTNFRKRLQRNNYEKANGVLYMSNWVYDYMKSKYPELSSKIYHVGGGSHMDISQVDFSKKKGNKFLFIGRDYLRKAGDLVIKAFIKVKEEMMPDAELHIAGPVNNPAPNIKGIFYYGDTDFEETRQLFNRCDVFVMPSRFEAYGLVFIEAMIYGLPCVARRYFEMPYFIEDGKTGMLIDDDDIDDLSRKMYLTINNKQIIKNVQELQSSFIEKYTWEAVGDRIAKIIE